MSPEQQLTAAFLTRHAPEAARQLELLEPPAAAALLAPLPVPVVAQALPHVVPYLGARILLALPRAQAGAVLALLSPAAALALLRRVGAAARGELLAPLAQRQARALERALAYPERSAGALADPFALVVPIALTVEQARQRIRSEPEHARHYVYALDAGARLVAVTTVKRLLAAPDSAALDSVCVRPVHSVPADAGVEELLQNPYWRDHAILPVAERDRTFVGALRLRTLLALAQGGHEAAPEPLGQALVHLWELYAMAGIGLITSLAAGIEAIAAAPTGFAESGQATAAAGGTEVPAHLPGREEGQP